jgi:transposase InsO family protein
MLKARDISERRACELVGIARSSYRYEPHPRDDSELEERLNEIATGKNQRRSGYRTAWGILRQEGWKINMKRVRRVWREEGLQQPRKKSRKRRTGDGHIPVQARRPNHVWCYDFIHDSCENGRNLRFLTLLDEFTRECLAIEAGHSVTSKEVIAVLQRVFEQHGQPDYLRSDNGSEFIAKRLQQWLGETGAEAFHIDPGSPWQNAYEESFHGTFRRECLELELFGTDTEAGVIVEKWRRHYNHRRPHSSLGYLTPESFEQAWARAGRSGVKAAAPKPGDLTLPAVAGPDPQLPATVRPPRRSTESPTMKFSGATAGSCARAHPPSRFARAGASNALRTAQ